MKSSKTEANKAQVHVVGLPPYKQTPADKKEKQSQEERKDRLRREVFSHKNEGLFFAKKIVLSIRYQRAKGLSDAANIIGGIADALQGVLYLNDARITEIRYIENLAPEGAVDEYWVEVVGENS